MNKQTLYYQHCCKELSLLNTSIHFLLLNSSVSRFPRIYYSTTVFVSTLIIIRNVSWAVNQDIRMISEDYVTLKTGVIWAFVSTRDLIFFFIWPVGRIWLYIQYVLFIRPFHSHMFCFPLLLFAWLFPAVGSPVQVHVLRSHWRPFLSACLFS